MQSQLMINFIKDEKTRKYKIDVDVYDANGNHLSSEQVETIINDINNYNVYTYKYVENYNMSYADMQLCMQFGIKIKVLIQIQK